MRVLLLYLALLWPGLATAQAVPALYDVAGVASNDVLNIRAKASAATAIVGGLAPDAKGVEVVALSADGKWAQVNHDEGAGWVALRFLQPQDHADWWVLENGLQCSGTEPFWTLYFDSDEKSAHLNTPEGEGSEMGLIAVWPGSSWQPVAAAQFAGESGGGIAVVRAQSCSDGMSDRIYGLSLDLFLQATRKSPGAALHGCCSLAP